MMQKYPTILAGALILASTVAMQPAAMAMEDEGDPVSREASRVLDENGLIARQSRLGEGILILDRQLQHAEAIERLVNVLGPDAQIEIAPGEFVSASDTPAGMRARIEMIRLEQEIETLLHIEEEEDESPRPARVDGSEFFDSMDSQSDQDTRPEREAAPPVISLREISGTAEDLFAVIQYGNTRVRVREGETVAQDIRITHLDREELRLIRDGREISFFLAR